MQCDGKAWPQRPWQVQCNHRSDGELPRFGLRGVDVADPCGERMKPPRHRRLLPPAPAPVSAVAAAARLPKSSSRGKRSEFVGWRRHCRGRGAALPLLFFPPHHRLPPPPPYILHLSPFSRLAAIKKKRFCRHRFPAVATASHTGRNARAARTDSTPKHPHSTYIPHSAQAVSIIDQNPPVSDIPPDSRLNTHPRLHCVDLSADFARGSRFSPTHSRLIGAPLLYLYYTFHFSVIHRGTADCRACSFVLPSASNAIKGNV